MIFPIDYVQNWKVKLHDETIRFSKAEKYTVVFVDKEWVGGGSLKGEDRKEETKWT